MYTAGSQIIGGNGSEYYDAKDLVKDPYSNGFWTASAQIIKKITAKQSNYTWTEEPIVFTNRFLPNEPGYYTYPALFAGYNGVLYFAYKINYTSTLKIIEVLLFP